MIIPYFKNKLEHRLSSHPFECTATILVLSHQNIVKWVGFLQKEPSFLWGCTQIGNHSHGGHVGHHQEQQYNAQTT
jgi:hypothetical protein